MFFPWNPRGGARMDPVGRIYKENHYTLLHTKYESSGPCGLGEDFLKFFPWRPRGGARMDPRDTVGRIYKEEHYIYIYCYKQNMKALGLVVWRFFYVLPMTPPPGAWLAGMDLYKKDHYTLLHTKYESSGPCGFGEDFFMFCPITPPGRGLYGPQGHGWERTTIQCYTQNMKGLGEFQSHLAQNLKQPFPLLNDALDKIWSRSALS